MSRPEREGDMAFYAPDQVARASPGEELLRVDSLVKHFHDSRRFPVRAVEGVSLAIRRGEALGIVGESGSGKSTLARCLLRLTDVTSGAVAFEGRDITRARGGALRRVRAEIQMVFQDPAGSLDPRQKIAAALEEPLRLLGSLTTAERKRRVDETLELVRLSHTHLDRYPHQLSGGQQQRVGIARALLLRPKLCVLDEPTSALDSPVRRDVLELLGTLRAELGLAYLVISHDLAAVESTCDRVAVMYLGRVVEEAPTDKLFSEPLHPYTRALLSSSLEARHGRQRGRLILYGEPPSPADPPSGCTLHPRCPIAVSACAVSEQTLRGVGVDHQLACMRITGGEQIQWPTDWQVPVTT